MATYRFKIVGVHYAINPDSTSREEETELMHQRTAQRLRELDEKRPAVVLIPEPTNPVEARAVMARVEGARIGYVSTAQLDTLHALFQASGKPILKATIESVEARKHGWMNICVETDEEVRIELQNQQDSPWAEWTCTLPELPMVDSRFAQMEAEVMLDDVLSKYPISSPSAVTQSEAKSLEDTKQDEPVDASGILRRDAPLDDKDGKESVENLNIIDSYIRLWLESSLHDLSNEARLMREHYIMRLKQMTPQNEESPQEDLPSRNVTPDAERVSQNATPLPEPLPRIRALVYELEKQRTAICGQKRMNLRVGKWWKELLASGEMDRLWKTWATQMEGNWEQGVNKLVTPLRALPFDLYVYIGDKKIFFSRLHYSGVPRKKYWQVISLMLLHERTLMEMNPKGGNETLYPLDGETRPQKEGGGDETSHPLGRETRPQVEEGRCNHKLPHPDGLGGSETERLPQEGCPKSGHPQESEKPNETFTITIPKELKTPEAKKVLARLQKKGILDADLQPVKLSNTQKAVLAWELTERLRIRKRWAVMATLWKCNPETLRKSRDKGYGKQVSSDFEKKIKPIIHY